MTSLRLVYLRFPVSLIALLGVLAALSFDADGGISAGVSLLFVLGSFVASWVGLAWTRQRGFDVATSEQAAAVYKLLMILKLAFAVWVALIGFVFTFLADSITPYFVGLILAAPGFWLAAPTSADLARRQRQLGDEIDLLGGLLGQAA